jgi:hypothetical protein
MPDTASPSLHPALLPPGTPIGPWRVVDWAGKGVHGAVYRAVRIGQEHLPPVALKLALLPEDPRFARERELLSRTLGSDRRVHRAAGADQGGDNLLVRHRSQIRTDPWPHCGRAECSILKPLCSWC